MHIFRNKITGGIMLTILILLLAACGGKGEATEPAQSSASEESASATNEGAVEPAKRTVTHLRGTSEIPAKIERIVVLSAAYVDHLLAIGEKPVGVNVEVRYGGDYLPYLADQLQGVSLVGSADSPNLEAILELEPDVILIESRTAESSYSELNKIAPTIVLGTEWLDYLDYAKEWTNDLLTIAGMYDKTEEAERVISELQARVADVRAKVGELSDKKLAYLRIRKDMIQIYAQQGHPTNVFLYQELGFEPADLTPKEQREDLSMETLPQLGAERLVLEVDPNGSEFRDNMKESALWNGLPAVQNGNVYETDSFWLFKGWGVIGRGEILDEVLGMIQ
ncbi:iron-siderophore ABC transporter substrate-binding protein [Paenibacillus oryzae]|uniref:ABC transporter substrate-binding protein n=1 Tax=Paenibacillus oryzae TaxID=1844972 RepID=UPI000B17F495|nr:iron-siderophore ABC transporter substrate-binding protein [Paenibacillus oryzae]